MRPTGIASGLSASLRAREVKSLVVMISSCSRAPRLPRTCWKKGKVPFFEEKFREIKTPNVHLLLARFDQIIAFDRQKVVYGATPVTILNRGHVTGAPAAKDIRNRILAHL